MFLGSCTNARLSDLIEASHIIKGQQVHPNITAIVVPGSRTVKKEAEALGLDKLFKDAGFEWREPGCSMCLGMNQIKFLKEYIVHPRVIAILKEDKAKALVHIWYPLLWLLLLRLMVNSLMLERW